MVLSFVSIGDSYVCNHSLALKWEALYRTIALPCCHVFMKLGVGLKFVIRHSGIYCRVKPKDRYCLLALHGVQLTGSGT